MKPSFLLPLTAAACLVPPVSGAVDFATEVRPILEDHCIDCHGDEKQKSGLRLDTALGLLRGGESGEALLVGGKSAESYLFKRVSTTVAKDAMPPKGKRLSAEQMTVLQRWIDEGVDFQAFTYAKYGGLILKQPKSLVYQIFDAKSMHLLEPRYSTSEPFKSDTLEGLVKQLNVDHEQAMKSLKEYNDNCGHGGPFNAAVLDGLHTEGIDPPKTNWAQKLDTPPYVSWPVTGGITFTFGGLKIDKQARVISTGWKPIPGLYTCGEMVGGLFHYNYPLGTGLMSGVVFGRIAGREAAKEAAGGKAKGKPATKSAVKKVAPKKAAAKKPAAKKAPAKKAAKPAKKAVKKK